MRQKPCKTSADRRRMPALSVLRRRAVVLIIVLVVIVVLALAAYAFTELMLAHYEGVLHHGRQVQARALVDSGSDAVRIFLMQDDATQSAMGGRYDNPAFFRALPIVYDDTPDFRGNVTVLAPAQDPYGNYGGVRFGMEDESSRINLNTILLADGKLAQLAVQILQAQAGLDGEEEDSGDTGNIVTASSAADAAAEDEDVATGARGLLLTLPGMTPDVADAILDWMDDDDEPREFGAEFDYYATLQPGYSPRNGPLISVEELLLVRGVTPQLLFGLDQNRNGVVDPHEGLGMGDIDPTGVYDRGWAAFFTLFSMERNYSAAGMKRIDVNQSDLQALFDELSLVFDEEEVTFIIAFRQRGEYKGEEEGEIAAGELNLGGRARNKLNNVLDLYDKRVEVTFEGDENPTILQSPFSFVNARQTLPLVMDNLTVNPAETIPGRISLNEAPRVVLMGIPGMTAELADAIISARQNYDPLSGDPNWNHETWLLTEGVATPEEMKALMPFVCARGDVLRAQIVGYYQGGGASSRAEVVFDTTGLVPRVLFWRDMSHLGRGYPLEVLGVDLGEGL